MGNASKLLYVNIVALKYNTLIGDEGTFVFCENMEWWIVYIYTYCIFNHLIIRKEMCHLVHFSKCIVCIIGKISSEFMKPIETTVAQRWHEHFIFIFMMNSFFFQFQNKKRTQLSRGHDINYCSFYFENKKKRKNYLVSTR